MATAHPATTPDQSAYDRATAHAFRTQTLEEIMESTGQSTQRGITVASFELIRAARPDVHCFSELLVLYPTGRAGRLARVVPDNMIVVHAGEFGQKWSYQLPKEPAGPFAVFEYVSKGNPRKDREKNRRRYERELRVPYYLLFEPEKGQLALFHLPPGERKYAAVPPDAAGRLPIPELQLGVGLIDGWVRFWFEGRLLPLPIETGEALKAERQARQTAEAEVARLKAELERLRGS